MEYELNDTTLVPKGDITLRRFLLKNEDTLKELLSTKYKKVVGFLQIGIEYENELIYMGVTDRKTFTTDIPKGKANRLIDCVYISQDEPATLDIYFKKVEHKPIDASLFK